MPSLYKFLTNCLKALDEFMYYLQDIDKYIKLENIEIID
jgi:hypothetical protein